MGGRPLTISPSHRLSFATNLAQLYLQNNSISVIENLPKNLIRLALDGNAISDKLEVGISDMCADSKPAVAKKKHPQSENQELKTLAHIGRGCVIYTN